MKPEKLLAQISTFCDQQRALLRQHTLSLKEFERRLTQINQQLRKNIELRDTQFAPQFNEYVQELHKQLADRESVWQELRAQARPTFTPQWAQDNALAVKGFNSKAKALAVGGRAFAEQYDLFCKQYKNFTAFKLNVWLLTACQTDVEKVQEKVLFFAREISRHIGGNPTTYES